MTDRIYKVMPRTDWDKALVSGTFKGAAVDLADGYIHFSTREQVRETVAKHFGGQKDLLLIAFEGASFGAALKWEPSRGGDLFPHLYTSLQTDAAIAVYPLVDMDDGHHEFPEQW